VTTERPGLRERKRLATHRAIERAVLELIGERGLDGVTVEEISDRADVSPRTFFNYFPSKEAAAIGGELRLAEDDRLDAFLASDGPLLDDLARLLSSAIEDSGEQVELLQLRKDVLRQHPHLFARRMASMRSFEEQLAETVSRRLGDADPGSGARARLVALVAMAAVRHGWVAWAESDGREALADTVRRSFDALHGLFEPAGELGRRTTAGAVRSG